MEYTNDEVNILDQGFQDTYVHNLVVSFLHENGEPDIVVENIVFYKFLSEKLAHRVPPKLGALLTHTRIMGDRLVINAIHMDFTRELRRQFPPQTRPSSSSEDEEEDVPGLPLIPDSIPIAMRELRLPEADATKALAPHVPSGGTIVVEGYPEPLYHETAHASFGAGAENRKGANTITYFYIRRRDRYYLVAWGHHIKGKDGKPTYTVDEQYDVQRGRLRGNILKFT